MRAFSLLAAATLAASAAAQGVATDCGAAKGAAGTFSRLVLNPATPVAGSPFNLLGTGTLNEVRRAVHRGRGAPALETRFQPPRRRAAAPLTHTHARARPFPPPLQAVTGGTGDINVLYLGVTLFQGSFATCGNSSVSLPLGAGTLLVDSLACPTIAGKAGGMAINITVSIPTGVPPGAYEVQLTANDQAAKLAFCADIQFAFDAPAPPAAGRASLRGAIVEAPLARDEEEEEAAGREGSPAAATA
jgi:hypothetical protein